MTETLSDSLAGLLDAWSAQPQRWPVVRTGERDPFPPVVRAVVHARDGGYCHFCGITGPLELDHIVPWSAGGSDRSDNLRTLCSRCNSDRSNYRDWIPPRRYVGVTRQCGHCAELFSECGDEWDDGGG